MAFRLPVYDVPLGVRCFRLVRAFVFGFCLISCSHVQAQPAPITAALKSDKPRVKIAAMIALSKSRKKYARPLIVKMLKDRDPSVRAAAAESLGILGDIKALSALRAHNDVAPFVATHVERATVILEAKEKRQAGKNPNAKTVVVMPVKDFSKKVPKNLLDKLHNGFIAGLRRERAIPFDVYKTQRKSGFGAILSIGSVDEMRQGALNILTVTCDMTVVKLPQNALQMQASATAGGGFKSALNTSQKRELMNDGITECIPSLLGDFVDFIKKKNTDFQTSSALTPDEPEEQPRRRRRRRR